MALTKTEVKQLYKSRAKLYDYTAYLYYLIGFRVWAYRKQAVQRLGLKTGDTVVEIGCGTGLNFELLQKEVGPSGRIVGVDITSRSSSTASLGVD